MSLLDRVAGDRPREAPRARGALTSRLPEEVGDGGSLGRPRVAVQQLLEQLLRRRSLARLPGRHRALVQRARRMPGLRILLDDERVRRVGGRGLSLEIEAAGDAVLRL